MRTLVGSGASSEHPGLIAFGKYGLETLGHDWMQSLVLDARSLVNITTAFYISTS